KNVEDFRDLRPEMTPAEAIAVGDVEGLVGAARLGRGPQRGAGEMRRFGHLVDRVISARPAGKTQWQAEPLRDRGVDRDGGQDAHRCPRRETADRLRPQLDEVPTLAMLAGGEPVDLIEV